MNRIFTMCSCAQMQDLIQARPGFRFLNIITPFKKKEAKHHFTHSYLLPYVQHSSLLRLFPGRPNGPAENNGSDE